MIPFFKKQFSSYLDFNLRWLFSFLPFSKDWIALVKAAAVAAAKNKAGVKPRTSANSNKDKEDRKWFKVPSKKEETSTSAIVQKVQKKEEQPTSSETFGIYKITFYYIHGFPFKICIDSFVC